jgi:hypothetical protein
LSKFIRSTDDGSGHGCDHSASCDDQHSGPGSCGHDVGHGCVVTVFLKNSLNGSPVDSFIVHFFRLYWIDPIPFLLLPHRLNFPANHYADLSNDSLHSVAIEGYEVSSLLFC